VRSVRRRQRLAIAFEAQLVGCAARDRQPTVVQELMMARAQHEQIRWIVIAAVCAMDDVVNV